MVKKVSAKKEQVVAQEVEEVVSETVKQKKENAQKMVKAIKKMNAKLKESVERKQVAKAVQAL